MAGIFAVAQIHLVELWRRHTFALTLLGGLGLLLLPGAVTSFGMAGFGRVSKDIGLTMLGLAGAGLALFLGATAVPSDVERKMAYPVLTRPMTRLAYLLGKFLGVATWLGGSVATMGMALFLGLGMSVREWDAQVLVASAVAVLQCWLLVGITMLLSTGCSSVLAGSLGLLAWFVGGLSDLYIRFFLQSEGGNNAVLAWAMRAVKACLPDFELFDIKNAVVHGEPLGACYLGALALYAVAWLALVLVVGGRMLEVRDL